MKYRIVLYGLSLLLAGQTVAQQAKKELSDSLIGNKELIAQEYFPRSEGHFYYIAYQMDSAVFAKQVNALKQRIVPAINAEKNTVVKELKYKDLDYYTRNLWNEYKGLYGLDSAASERLNKLLVEKKGDTAFNRLLDSASKALFTKRLTSQQRASYDSMFLAGADANNAALFKQSAAYRTWVNTYIGTLKNTKYKGAFPFDYDKRFIYDLTVVSKEISDPYIREYMSYVLVGTILKSVKDTAAKVKAYHDFIAVATNPAYKKELSEFYNNYKNMTSNALAPDFSYQSISNSKVSLQSLRGKYVYIDVWATWCAPCKAEIPFLTKIEEAYEGKKIHFVSLSVDRQADKSKWQEYVTTHQLKGIQVMADNDFNSDFVKKFNINSIPRFILIAPDGKIISGDAKRPSDPELRKQLDALL
jgi:thiol-disulfide isomerase/thioredoxin